MKIIYLSILLLSINTLKAQLGVFKVRPDGNLHIGFNASFNGVIGQKCLLFGNNGNTSYQNGQWGLVHYGNCLRIFKPWPSYYNNIDHFVLKDDGMLGIGMSPWQYTNWSYNGWLNKLWINGRVIANAYIQYSDSTIKENVSTIPNSLTKLTQIRPVSYNYIMDIGIGGITSLDSNSTDSIITKTINASGNQAKLKDSASHFGLIAQELELIYPNLVVDLGNTKGINYMELIPILIRGIQDQQKEIEDLKAEVQAIKNVTPIATTKTVLYQNDPNPFGTTSKIKYYIDETATFTLAKIEIRDLTGLLKESINLTDQSGLGEININCNNLNNGYYIYSIKLDNSIKDNKMMLVEK